MSGLQTASPHPFMYDKLTWSGFVSSSGYLYTAEQPARMRLHLSTDLSVYSVLPYHPALHMCFQWVEIYLDQTQL